MLYRGTSQRNIPNLHFKTRDNLAWCPMDYGCVSKDDKLPKNEELMCITILLMA